MHFAKQLTNYLKILFQTNWNERKCVNEFQNDQVKISLVSLTLQGLDQCLKYDWHN